MQRLYGVQETLSDRRDFRRRQAAARHRPVKVRQVRRVRDEMQIRRDNQEMIDLQ